MSRHYAVHHATLLMERGVARCSNATHARTHWPKHVRPLAIIHTGTLATRSVVVTCVCRSRVPRLEKSGRLLVYVGAAVSPLEKGDVYALLIVYVSGYILVYVMFQKQI